MIQKLIDYTLLFLLLVLIVWGLKLWYSMQWSAKNAIVLPVSPLSKPLPTIPVNLFKNSDGSYKHYDGKG